MSGIKLLSKSLSQKIAAGEVVERPASVVKELLENSIDAGSTFITCEVEQGGKNIIRLSDNGSGISPEEVELAFLRHATSKIETEDDLYNISCMGFRGEALYSISAVSKTTMLTKTGGNELGKKAVVEGGQLIEITDAGCPDGTTIVVKELFYNTPARLKFMKSNSAETSQIASVVQKMILSRPEISIKLISNGQLIYQSSGDGNIKNAVHSVYGANVASTVKKFEYIYNEIKIHGVLGGRDTFRSSRINQTLFVNNRYVKDSSITQAVESAYGSVLMKGKFPFFVIFIDVDTKNVDVNVHPQKLFVKFSNQKEINAAVYEAVKTFSKHLGAIPDMIFNEEASIEASKPIRQAHKFESRKFSELTAKSLEDKKDMNREGEDKKNSELYTPRIYDYKKELELYKTIKETSVLKQTVSEYTAKKDGENDIEQESFLSEKYEIKVIGVAFDTYIIIEYENSLYLIDQHAAHERLIYDRFLDEYKKSKVISQQLLIPQECKITYEEQKMLSEYIAYFEKLGYKMDLSENLSVIINSVPHILGQPRLTSFFVELFDLMSQDSDRDELSVVKKIISMSCKKAVKAGDKLSDKEIKELLSNIKKENIPLTCPHGRPFIMKIDKKLIDKKAGRIN